MVIKCMENKTCTKCVTEKPISEFYPSKDGKLGVRSICKQCSTKAHYEWFDKNKRVHKKLEAGLKMCSICLEVKGITEFYSSNTGKYGVGTWCKTCFKGNSKEVRLQNKTLPPIIFPPDTIKTCTLCDEPKTINEFYKQPSGKYGVSSHCKECTSIERSNYYKDNKDKVIYRNKEYYQENVDKKCKYSRDYFKSHIEERREYRRGYEKSRKNIDAIFNLNMCIRVTIRTAFNRKGVTKNKKAEQILGCTIKEFITYIESRFESWMTLDNYGKYNGKRNSTWCFDHIIPISSAKTEEDVIRLNHHTNFQPLCTYENLIIKRDRLDYKKA